MVQNNHISVDLPLRAMAVIKDLLSSAWSCSWSGVNVILFYIMQFSFCFLKGFYMEIYREIYSVVVRCDQMCTLKLIEGNKD